MSDTQITGTAVDAPPAGTYAIDPSHSSVEFVVRHLGLAKVRGRFGEFSGTIVVGQDAASSSTTASIVAASIDTRAADRDAHLRSADFFDTDTHPTLEFRSTGLRRVDGEWLLDGDLTIVGVTRPVTLALDYEGTATDPWGNERIGVSAATKINREDFGLTWNQALETGGLLVAKDVRIEITVQAVKQA